MTETSPGWYPDPLNPIELLRWWDGSGWTEEVCERPIESPISVEETLVEERVLVEEIHEDKENFEEEPRFDSEEEIVSLPTAEVQEEETKEEDQGVPSELVLDEYVQEETVVLVEEITQEKPATEEFEKQPEELEIPQLVTVETEKVEPPPETLMKNNVVVVEEIVDKVSAIQEDPHTQVRCILVGKYEGFDETQNCCLLRTSLTGVEMYPPAFRNIFEMLQTAPTLKAIEEHFKEHSTSLLESLLALNLVVRIPNRNVEVKDYEDDITVLLSAHLYRNHELFPAVGEMIPLGAGKTVTEPETSSLVTLGILISGGVDCIATSLLKTAENLHMKPETAYEQFVSELPVLIENSSVWICPAPLQTES